MIIRNLTRSFHPGSLAVLLLALVAGCETVGQTGRREFAIGSIVLPADYTLRDDHKPESPIATGELLNRRSGARIRYASGNVPGVESSSLVFADPAVLKATHHSVIWSKSSGSGTTRKIVTLASTIPSGKQELYVSFPEASLTNFIAEIRSELEVTEIEQVTATFTPKKPSL